MNPKTRVLIVDDDVAMAKYLAAHLSRRNFEVTVASSGAGSVARLPYI